ncbi:MAG TPA: glycosyltransferase family 61 protein [Mucilaginibacter sp.]
MAILRPLKLYRSYSYIPKSNICFSELTGIRVLSHNEFQPVHRTAPQTVGNNLYWKFKRLLNDTPQETFVVEAKGWRVWGNQGAVITDNGYLLKDVSREFEKPYHSIFKQFKLVPPVVVKGTSAVITASGADMYYHWMFDILPRIKLLMDCGEFESVDHFILDYRDISFQKEALDLLKIDLSKISRANDHFNYHTVAERLLVPSLPSKLDVVSANACRFLINTFLDKKAASKSGNKIYLKRTGKRKIINSIEIESYLESLGFESVQCEDYSVAGQASLFHHADIIVGPHGAAFTNIVFCKPGTRVIEFFSPRWINPCYWTISNEVSLNYYYLVGEGAPPDEFSDATGTNEDIELDMAKLKKLFDQFPILN